MTNQTPAAGGDLVERVADAAGDWSIDTTDGFRVRHGIIVFGKWFDKRADAYEELRLMRARAAIEAMREPTEAMVRSGNSSQNDCILWDTEGDYVDLFDPVPAYRAMIDAALQEPKP